ncbi:MAG: hypothetical protein DRN81_04065 [Thermoproteota archaeon]|nr:MAG: hypothetical protein DRN81_04065 [Candidatus Korarchaeota archaeon]
MCGVLGIIGIGDYEPKKEQVRQEIMMFFATEILRLTEKRGEDATGIACLFQDCSYVGLKMGVSAQQFITRYGKKSTDYKGFMNVWRKKTSPAKIVIGHCRKPSPGYASPTTDNKNNHPICVGNIVGVHNGTLKNHEEIISGLKCKQEGSVDSEAIFHLLNFYTRNGEDPFSIEALEETCRRLDGTYAVLSFNVQNPYQLSAFRNGRPLELMFIRPLKMLIIASELIFLRKVVLMYNRLANLYGLDWPQLKKGDVKEALLRDDHVFLFSTTMKITNKTGATDLFLEKRVPMTDKVWKKTHTNQNNGTQHNAVINKHKHNKYKSNKSLLAWDENKGGYKRIESAEDYKTVLLDKDGKVTNICEPEKKS